MTCPRLALVSAALLSLPTVAPAQIVDTLIPLGSTWRYLDDGSDQGTAWSQVGFDDSTWAAGPAQLGYGDGDEATVVSYGPNPNDKFETTYFRHEFQVPNPALYQCVNLRLQRDDGAVVYLNGTEIMRANMPAGVITFETFAASTVSDADEHNLFWNAVDPALLLPGSNIFAVEIHQRTLTSSDKSFDLQLVASDLPFVTRGPYLQLATPTSIRVVWRTDKSTVGVVRYGTDPANLDQLVDQGASTTIHNIELAGLSPNRRYWYSVGTQTDTLQGGAGFTFRTPPSGGQARPLRIWALGDSGEANEDARAVRDAYTSFAGGQAPEVMLMLGDNAYPDGLLSQYQAAVFDMFPEYLRRTALWPTRGNHENSATAYYGLFRLPTAAEAGGLASGTEAYYSFDHGSVHFVCLDSDASDNSVGGAMYTWASQDIAATTQDWVICFWHHPPYTKGSHDSDTETKLLQMRQNFLPMLEAAGVDLVLCGHSHSYERSYQLDGHYGLSTTFDPAFQVDSGAGNPAGDGAYERNAGANRGTVYAVAGSSSKLTSGPLSHPAMVVAEMRLGSLVIDIDGGRLEARFLRDNGTLGDHFVIDDSEYEGGYCQAAEHAGGCEVLLQGLGTPSATPGGSFELVGADAPSSQFGILFYGANPNQVPFLGGTICVLQPFTRLPPTPTGGSGACGGELRVDFNSHIQAGSDAALVPGARVYAQGWYRDPGGANGSELTSAWELVIQP